MSRKYTITDLQGTGWWADTNDSFYEYWEDDECLWAMTEDEIAEQADRLA